MYKFYLFLFIMVFSISCTSSQMKEKTDMRFFSNSSYWNQPIPDNPEIDSMSNEWIGLMKSGSDNPNIGINAFRWTIPVYEADENTPVYTIHRHRLEDYEKKGWVTEREYFGHGPGFGEKVPIPENAFPDPEEDAHFAVIDRKKNTAWDMWGFLVRPDGSMESKTGMKYPLDGEGVFKTEEYNIIDGESVHFHGPSRASGVPAIAGLIMYDEVMQGRIEHKLAIATRYAAFREFVYPATWTDGFTPGGIPEGAVIQLDPDLDLSRFDLTEGELVVAKSLQEFGAVFVDVAQGNPLYAEGLWGHGGKSWEGILREWDEGINTIPIDHYRFLKVGKRVKKGDSRSLKMPYW